MSSGPETRGVVYRLLDANGRLLYVGSTADITARVRSHRASPAFRGRVASVHHTRRMPMSQAHRLEALTILTEQPLLNQLRNPLYASMTKAERSRRVHEALADCPLVTGGVPIIDDEPQALIDEMTDLDLVLGVSA